MWHRRFGLGIILLTGLLSALPARAIDPEIRLYWLTHDGHLRQHFLFGQSDEPGCHNLPIALSVHKIAVLGFDACQLFAAADCPADQPLTAYWKQKDKPATSVTRGTRWFLSREQENIDVKSWSCE